MNGIMAPILRILSLSFRWESDFSSFRVTTNKTKTKKKKHLRQDLRPKAIRTNIQTKNSSCDLCTRTSQIDRSNTQKEKKGSLRHSTMQLFYQ